MEVEGRYMRWGGCCKGGLVETHSDTNCEK